MKKTQFLRLEDMSEKNWQEIEDLTRQVKESRLYPNLIRASVASFVLWLTENAEGIQSSGREKRKDCDVPSDFH